MKHIKYRHSLNRCMVGVVSSIYCKTLAHINAMAHILLEDYPELTTESIRVLRYPAGPHKRKMGVEARVAEPKTDYVELPSNTLGMGRYP